MEANADGFPSRNHARFKTVHVISLYMHLRIRIWTGRSAAATYYAVGLSRGSPSSNLQWLRHRKESESAKNLVRMSRLMFSDWWILFRPTTLNSGHVTTAGIMFEFNRGRNAPAKDCNNNQKKKTKVLNNQGSSKKASELSFSVVQVIEEDQRSPPPLFRNSPQKNPRDSSLIRSRN
jgi:hypothetical protein